MAIGFFLAVPASAQDRKPEHVVPKPKRGGTRTTFVVRYESFGADAFGGDVIQVRGPRGTRCSALLISEPVGHEGGPQRIAMGPRVDEDDSDEYGGRFFIRPREDLDDGRTRTLSRWCRGVYRGWVEFEWENHEPTKHTRFRFVVR